MSERNSERGTIPPGRVAMQTIATKPYIHIENTMSEVKWNRLITMVFLICVTSVFCVDTAFGIGSSSILSPTIVAVQKGAKDVVSQSKSKPPLHYGPSYPESAKKEAEESRQQESNRRYQAASQIWWISIILYAICQTLIVPLSSIILFDLISNRFGHADGEQDVPDEVLPAASYKFGQAILDSSKSALIAFTVYSLINGCFSEPGVMARNYGWEWNWEWWHIFGSWNLFSFASLLIAVEAIVTWRSFCVREDPPISREVSLIMSYAKVMLIIGVSILIYMNWVQPVVVQILDHRVT